MDNSNFSLADLAQADQSDVEVITSRIPAEGIYTILGMSVTGSVAAAQEGKAPLPRFTFKNEILEANLINDSLDPMVLIGKSFTVSVPLWADEGTGVDGIAASFNEGIGLLKGHFKKAGLPFDGALGGMEGAPAGFLDGIAGHQYRVKVRHGKRASDGETVAYYDWMPDIERD